MAKEPHRTQSDERKQLTSGKGMASNHQSRQFACARGSPGASHTRLVRTWRASRTAAGVGLSHLTLDRARQVIAVAHAQVL